MANINQILEQAEGTVSKAQQFLADLTQARHEIASAPRNLYGQVEQTIIETRRDVRRASALQQMLPVAVAAIGFIAGQPALGIGAGAALWYTGQQAGAA